MAVHAGYEAATRCTGGPTPGARQFMSWFLGVYGRRGGKNLGIYNCRTVRGGADTSLHGEGRAVDFGINPHGAAYGDELAELLRTHSAELGIQCVIWKRRIWSGAKPSAGWRAYTGTNPHVDHLHVELTRAAAASLTAVRVAQVLTPAPAPAPAPAPLRPDGDDAMYIKCQPTPGGPVDVAILSGPIFIGLGPDEIRSADIAVSRGAVEQWVTPRTWAALDRASQTITANPRPVDIGGGLSQLAELGAKVDDLISRHPAVGDDTALAAHGRAIDELTRRVFALETRTATPIGGTL